MVLTELLFNGAFNDLTASECAALLSVFVLQEKSKDKHELKDSLKKPLRELQVIWPIVIGVAHSEGVWPIVKGCGL